MRVTIRLKLLASFLCITAIIAVAGILAVKQNDRLYSSSIKMGEQDAPLNVAIMDMRYWLADGHIFLEEVLGGDTNESIEEVWEKMDKALRYCDAMISGGIVEQATILPVNDESLKKRLLAIREKLKGIITKAEERYDLHSGLSVAGSTVDGVFDTTYQSIQEQLGKLATVRSSDASEIQFIRYRLADTHLFLEELLSGDGSVDKTEVVDGFYSVRKQLFGLLGDGHKLVATMDSLLSQMNIRLVTSENYTSAGSKIDIEFDRMFDDLMRDSSNVEGLFASYVNNSLKTINTTYERSRLLIIAAIVLSIVFSIFIGIFLSNHIVFPIRKLIGSLEKMALGDLSERFQVSRNDEVGDIAKSIGSVQNSLKEAATLADQVAQGDYEVSITPKSDLDRLGSALRNMTWKLKEMSALNEEQLWLAENHSGLAEAVRGEMDISSIGEGVSNFLAKVLGVQLVSFYVCADPEKLTRFGSYGVGPKSSEYITEFGEGLLGQAAVSKEVIFFDNIPDDYFRLHSSLGDCLPKHIAVVPFLHENEVKGVIELGSCEDFSPVSVKFLQSITETVAIAVNSGQIHLRVNELLSESQSQTEELQTQQEELQASNEELEEKTNELLRSEAQLQSQQEELRVANEELAERSELLTRQKKELELKQKELQQNANELELASKYKSEFLANMSHELRTPLNSILILSQLLSKNANSNLSEKQVEYSQTINSSGNDLLQLVNEILDLSKVEAGKMLLLPEDIVLNDFFTEIQRSFGAAAEERKLELSTEVDKALPGVIFSDPLRLRQIVKNLVGNAIKFTDKGSVNIVVCRPASEVDLSSSGLGYESSIAIQVKDTGVGIDDAKQSLVFEAFQQQDGTTSRKYGGTGLGLSIVKEMTHFLGGEIQLESAQGKGSTFTVYLPEKLSIQQKDQKIKSAPRLKSGSNVSADISVKGQTDKLQGPPPEHSSIIDDRKKVKLVDRSILAIEDDANFAKVLLELAHQHDFKCILAEDGEAGLACADYYRPSAIVLDIGLPRIDGWAVFDRLKENPSTRHIPVHFISATDSSGDALEKGAIGFLTKPVTEEDLTSALGNIQNAIAEQIKKLLVVEDDEVQLKSLVELLDNDDVTITAVRSGEEAFEKLQSEHFDCLILDLGLSKMSGFELLEKLSTDDSALQVPVIVYTGKDLSAEEEMKLKMFADRIIIKGAKSPERLLSEASLFLNKVDTTLPVGQKEGFETICDPETLFCDKKILIVDDDMRNVFALSTVLKEKGVVVEVAKNGKEALRAVTQSAEFDLVLMDIMMPEMDGYEAMQKIREQPAFKELPILALTAKAMKGDRNKCIEAGANDYLAKPVDIDRLFSLLRVWLYSKK